MTQLVGVIGLGPMGLPLALRLIDCGFSVVATSRSEETRSAASRQGITVVDHPSEVAAHLQSAAGASHGKPCVVISLPAWPQVWEACFGERGLYSARIADPLAVIDTSTYAPRDSRVLAEELHRRGAAAVDAPLSGGPTGAREGTLSVMVGGTARDVQAATDVLQAIAGRLTVCGDPGSGQVAKACNQMLVTSTLAAVAETLLTASALGADPAAVREALLGGYAASRVLELHGERMLQRGFYPWGSAQNNVKDIEIIRQLTEDVIVPEIFKTAARGCGETGS